MYMESFPTMSVLLSTWFVGILLISSQVKGDCNIPLGMTNRTIIPDEKITASSSLNANSFPFFARLRGRGEGAWCSAPSDNTPYLQIELDKEKTITRIITQGSYHKLRWVTGLQLKYLTEGKWVPYVKADGKQLLEGNTGSRSLKENVLQPPIRTRFIRIYPSQPRDAMPGSSLKNISCLRLELYGCAAQVDGGWGEWSDWSECSLTCGLGMRSRVRKCDSPKPQNGGRPCDGKERMDSKFCRKRKCPGEGYLEGYSGSGHGWETYSGGRKSGESESGLGGWVEHSGNGQVWGENDDEDF